jgi:hypothetical protein
MTNPTNITAHAESEGANDYTDRRADVEAGQQDESWAWPFTMADEAYINGVGVSKICEAIGVDESAWDGIAEAWCEAFRRGYEQAHEESLTDSNETDGAYAQFQIGYRLWVNGGTRPGSEHYRAGWDCADKDNNRWAKRPTADDAVEAADVYRQTLTDGRYRS